MSRPLIFALLLILVLAPVTFLAVRTFGPAGASAILLVPLAFILRRRVET